MGSGGGTMGSGGIGNGKRVFRIDRGAPSASSGPKSGRTVSGVISAVRNARGANARDTALPSI